MSLFRPLLRLQRSLPFARNFSQTASNSAAKITILGRLAAQPEFLPSPSEKTSDLVRYAVASSYGPGRTKTSWFKVAFFTRGNERLKEMMMSLGKGSLVWVEGDAYMHKYEDKEGREQSTFRVIQRNIEFLDKKGVASTHEDREAGAEAEAEGDSERE